MKQDSNAEQAEVKPFDYERKPESDGGRWSWQYWIPAILLGIFVIWHLGTPMAESIKARFAWRTDRARLVEAYSKMQDANFRDDLVSYSLDSERANITLSQLRSDLAKLQGSSGQLKREQFLQGSTDCVEDLQFDLTPPKRKVSEYCLNLIRGR